MHKLVLWIQGVLVPFLGPPGIFVAAFLDSSLLSLPEINDVLVVTSSAARPAQAWLAIALATLGSLGGCTLLWYAGRRGGEALLRRRFGPGPLERTRAAFRRWDVLALAVPALLPPPMPFKMFVFSAGVFGFSFRRFALTLLVARGLRYAAWGILGVIYGAAAQALLARVDSWCAEHLPAVFLAVAAVLLTGLAAARVRRGREPLRSASGDLV